MSSVETHPRLILVPSPINDPLPLPVLLGILALPPLGRLISPAALPIPSPSTRTACPARSARISITGLVVFGRASSRGVGAAARIDPVDVVGAERTPAGGAAAGRTGVGIEEVDGFDDGWHCGW